LDAAGVTEPAAAAIGLVRCYPTRAGATMAVDHAELSVAEGEVLGITGPSGSGKSTLLRLLGGIERPDRGALNYAGQPAWPRRRARRSCYPRPGYVMPVFQDPAASLDWRWPVWRTLTEPLAGRHSASERRGIAAQWLEGAGIASRYAAAKPHELSGGQCQRVALLRALVARPGLLVADEPTARQDVITAAAIAGLLRKAAGDGTAVVVVSHNTDWLATFVDRMLHMQGGRLSE